jgi:vacuolar-type H+-ATPase subunit E/Vma4
VGWANYIGAPADDITQVLRDEAEDVLDDAQYEAEDVLDDAQYEAEDALDNAQYEAEDVLDNAQYRARDLMSDAARYRARDLMSDAACEEELPRITEQAETSKRVILLAEEEARRLMETAHQRARTIQEDAHHRARTIQEDAHHRAKTIQEDARKRAQRLLHEADLQLATPSMPTLGDQVRDQIMRLIVWFLRVFALFALVSFIYSTQISTHISFNSILAILFFSLILALVDGIVDASGLALFVPMFIASIVYAGMREELSPGQLLLAAFYLLYQRFGIVLGLVTLQFVIIAVLAGFGSSIGIAIVAIAGAAEWSELIRLSGWLISMMGVLIGIFIGEEFGRALAAVSFVSVLSGLTLPCPSRREPTSSDQSACC